MAETAQPWSFTGMLADPNFQLALANVGKSLDPEGAGGIIGGAAANMISSKAAQTAIEKRDAARQKQIQQLIAMHGGLTAKDTPGITTVKRTPSGAVAFELDLPPLDTSIGPGSQTSQYATQRATPAGTGTVLAPKETPAAIATTPTAAPAPLSATPTRTRQPDIADIAPFLLSPGGFEAGSLAGLNPEQVAAMGRLDTEREALRMRSVQELIQARNVQSEIAYRETAGDLNRQQAANLRAQEPHIAAKMLADIDQSKEAARASRAVSTREETLLPIKVEQEQAQTKEIQTRTNRITELLGLEKQNIQANIKQSMAAAGLSDAHAAEVRALYPARAELLDKQNREYAEIKLDGKVHTARAIDLVKERNDNIQKILELEKARQQKIRDARKDEVTMLQHANKAEANIKSGSPGGYKPKSGTADPMELTPDIEMFHATSKNPYVYVLEDNSDAWTGYNTKLKRIDLPKVNGHQYTAEDVYNAATDPSRSMTVQQYLEQVFYPMLRQPVPWKAPKPAQ